MKKRSELEHYNKGFYDLNDRQKLQRRISTLKQIKQQYGETAEYCIKQFYSWREMSPAWMVFTAESRKWEAA